MSKSRRRERVWRPEVSDQKRTRARILRASPGNRRTLTSFAEWLSSTRGLESSSISTRIHPACTFVDAVTARCGRSCAASFRGIDAELIEDVFVELGREVGQAGRRSLQASMRLFLRFAAQRGWVAEELVSAVPSLVSYRASQVPRGLTEQQLTAFLDPPFRRGGCRRRDRAIVILLASYGARRGQVSALRFADIDWQASTIEFAAHKGGKKVCHALTGAVSEALIAYLSNERPPSESDCVFVRHRRPYERLSPTAISVMVQQRMADRGLPPFGPHALRHTFACRLLRAGQPVKIIADLLGHRSLAAVGIYAKVDRSRLLEVAGEWLQVRR